MAKQLHVIHRHTSTTLKPYSGDTKSAYSESADIAKLALGEIAVQHNADDPALYIKVGETSASTEYVKFTPGGGVESIQVEGNDTELTGEVLFASGSTPTSGETIAEVGFEITSGVVSANIIVDTELKEDSTNPVTNAAITKAILDDEEVVAAALNELNKRVSDVENKTVTITIEGDNYITGTADGGDIKLHSNVSTTLSDTQESGSLSDSKAVVDYVKEKIGEGLGGIKNITTINGQNVPTSASTYILSGGTLTTISTTTGASNITTTVSVTTASTSDSNTVGLVTNSDIRNYINNLLTSVMEFKGATGSIPSGPSKGDVYIANAEFKIGEDKVEVGDYIVYDGTEWTIIEKNDTGVVTSTGLTSGKLAIASGTNELTNSGTVGTSTLPIYLNDGVPTAIDAPVAGTSDLSYGTEVTLATIEGLEIKAKLPELDTELDSGSTKAVTNRAITKVILDNELVTAAALNDLKNRIDNVESEIEEIDIDVPVVNPGATIPVNGGSQVTIGTIKGTDLTAQVSMQSLTIAGANSNKDGITFNGTTAIEILTLDCGEY